MKVSVIMSTYNGSKRIIDSIESILKQTYQDFEFIICNDASTDNTWKILKYYEKKDSRIKLIHNERNLGLAASLNKCLSVAKGDLIARMDDDDKSHINRLEKQVKFLDENMQYSLCGTWANYVDEQGVWGGFQTIEKPGKKDIFRGASFIHPSVMLRKTAVEKVGGYTVTKLTRRCEDFDLWCKLYALNLYGYNIQEILLDYYESTNVMKKRTMKRRWELFLIKLEKRKKLKLSKKYILIASAELLKGLFPSCIIILIHRYRAKVLYSRKRSKLD